MILVSKRRKAALLSSRRTFTWKPAREFKGREHRFVPAAVMRRKPNYRAGPGGRGGGGHTDRNSRGGGSRRTSSCSQPHPAAPAPGHDAVEGTSLPGVGVGGQMSQCRPQPHWLPLTPPPAPSPSSHPQHTGRHQQSTMWIRVCS